MTVVASRRKSPQQGQSAPLQAQISSLRAQLVRSQRLAAVGTLAVMVAHEFNNILTPMHNYAQLAARGDEGMCDKAVRFALDGSARAAAICRALLDLTKTDGEEEQKVSLVELVDETLTAMGRDLDKDGIRLIKKVPARLAISTRPVELKQVLLNLLLNARSAVLDKGAGKSISISAIRSNGSVLLRVADTGVGIAPENLKNIFVPFFTTKNGDDGSGLGLAVCKQIVKSMKGRLTVRSQLGEGTVFTVTVPVRKTAAVKSRRSASKPIARSA